MQRDDGQTLLYVDRHLCRTARRRPSRCCASAASRVRAPERAFATPDHYVPTDSRDARRHRRPGEARDGAGARRTTAPRAGIRFFGLDDARQGIVHVVGPEQGLSLPGMLIVCGDSHTSTHGALGALAFGIGATEVAHVLATQTLWQRKPQHDAHQRRRRAWPRA